MSETSAAVGIGQRVERPMWQPSPEERARDARCGSIRCIIQDALVDDYRAFRKGHRPSRDGRFPPAATHVHRAGLDPERKPSLVPELAFVPIDEEHARTADQHARALVEGGARRVIGIVLDSDELGEWSPSQNAWVMLDHDRPFEDPTFAQPIPIARLVRPSPVEAAEARRRNKYRYVERKLAEWEQQKVAEDFRDRWARRWNEACIGVIDELCTELGITVEDSQRAKIDELESRDLAQLFVDLLYSRRLSPSLTPWTEDERAERTYLRW